MQIKTLGELREFLANTIVEVKNGEIEIRQAEQINKLASQINESLYAEIKVAKIRSDNGEEFPQLGKMTIGSEN